MQINWKLRLKNKTTLLSLIGVTLTFIYTVLGIFEIVPPITQSMIGDLVLGVINILVALGIVVDPTTKGIEDSERAMNYSKPKPD